MPGVRLTAGADLRLPAGALRIKVGADGTVSADPLVPQLRTDMWPQWLLEAVGAAQIARDSAAEVARLAALSDRDEEALDLALGSELRGSMRAITASAFAVDAFYASAKSRSPAHPNQDAWRANQTPRYAQVFETLRYHLKLKPPGANQIRDRVEELFRFRDWAVHPGSRFREPVYRSDIDSGVDWHFAVFRGDNGVAAVANTTSMMDALVATLPRGPEELRQSYPAARRAMTAVLESYDGASLPSFDRATANAGGSEQRPTPDEPAR
jgi:hypothetical protein